MSLADEIKNQQSQYKDMPIGKKIEHFFFYNKWKVIIVLIVLFFVADTLITIFGAKDSAFSCILINAETLSSNPAALTKDFSDYSGIDTKRNEVRFDNYQMRFDTKNELNYSNVTAYDGAERIIALINAKELDSITAPLNMIKEYESYGYLADISTVLTSKNLDRLNKSNYEMVYQNNRLIAINIANSDRFNSYELYSDKENQYFAIICNAQNTDMINTYIEFLFSK